MVVVLWALIGALPGGAEAASPYPLGESAVTPTRGSTITVTQSAPTFEFTTSEAAGLQGVTVEIASSNSLGQDGTLADDYLVGFGAMTPRDSAPSRFAGTPIGPWYSTPGAYYFQFSGTRYPIWGGGSCPGGEGAWCDYASQIYTINVEAAPAPPVPAPSGPAPSVPAPSVPAPATPPAQADYLSAKQARAIVRSAIRQKARRRPHNLTYGCARQSSAAFRCRSSWFDRKYVWAVRVKAEAEAGEFFYSGRGRRASRSCLKRASMKRCARTVRW